MNTSYRDDLRKAFLGSSKQYFEDYVANLLRNPGAYTSKTDTKLKSYIIEVSIHPVRSIMEPRKKQEASSRAWFTFALAVLEPLCNGRSSCNRYSKVLNAIHDPQNGPVLHELLEGEPERVKAMIKNFFSMQHNNEEIKLSNWQNAEISKLQDFEIKEQSFTRWLKIFQNKLIDYLVSDLLHKESTIVGNSNEQLLHTEPTARVRWPYQKIQLTMEQIATNEDIEDLWIRERARQYRDEYDLKRRVAGFLGSVTIYTGQIFFCCFLLWLVQSIYDSIPFFGKVSFIGDLCLWMFLLLVVIGFILIFWFVYTVNWGLVKVKDLRTSLQSIDPDLVKDFSFE